MQHWWSNSKICLLSHPTEAWVPATPSRTWRKKALQHLLDLAKSCFPTFFHRHLSMINRNGSELPSSPGQESHKSSAFCCRAGMCSSCLAGLWGTVESSLGFMLSDLRHEPSAPGEVDGAGVGRRRRGGEVTGMVNSALSCHLEKWEEKTIEFSNQEIT